MKQADVKTGESYLFRCTDTGHRKNMIGTVVKVIGRKRKGKKQLFNHGMGGIGRPPIRFKLSNGQYANAGELAEINRENDQAILDDAKREMFGDDADLLPDDMGAK